MNNVYVRNALQIVLSAILTFLTLAFGELDKAMQILLIMIVCDYLTGVLKAWQKGTLSSKIGRDGVVKKIGYLVLVAVAYNVDKLTVDSGAIRTLVIYFFVANEGISILENWGAMGLPIPKVLLERLQQLKGTTTEMVEVDTLKEAENEIRPQENNKD